MTLHIAGTDTHPAESPRDLALRAFAHPVLAKVLAPRRRAKGRLKVLVYHNVVDEAGPLFQRQLQFLKSKYVIVSPDAIDGVLDDVHDDRPRLLLTFDDGFKACRRIVEDYMAPMGIKGVFFIPAALVGMTSRSERLRFMRSNLTRRGPVASLPTGADLMDLDDLRALAAADQTIGAHGFDHRALADLSTTADLHREVNLSGDTLDEVLGTSTKWFAYPFGQAKFVTAESYRLIRGRYKFCCTSVRGTNARDFSPHAILRETVNPTTPLSVLEFFVENGLGRVYASDARQVSALAKASIGSAV